MLKLLLDISSLVSVLLKLLYDSNSLEAHSSAPLDNDMNIVESNTLVSLVISLDKKHNNPAACASIPTTGSPSYNDGNKNTSNA